jgi:hypothetical protein
MLGSALVPVVRTPAVIRVPSSNVRDIFSDSDPLADDDDDFDVPSFLK